MAAAAAMHWFEDLLTDILKPPEVVGNIGIAQWWALLQQMEQLHSTCQLLRRLTICRAESVLGAQGSLQRTARTDLHELQDVCMSEGLQAADAGLWLEH
ncbi:MAG: hypothetical protein FRX49_06616 [Trebouxia sp. A1-2]|nr:MAG: hypothetical protein FRX49_06616 [Trebouxia sp. A1-2]